MKYNKLFEFHKTFHLIIRVFFSEVNIGQRKYRKKKRKTHKFNLGL